MYCYAKMSESHSKNPEEALSGVGEMKTQTEAFSGVGEMKTQTEAFSGEGDVGPSEVARPASSQDSDDDAGGGKRAVANSIFQACTAYRQNLWDGSDKNDDHDTSNRTGEKDNNSGLFVLAYPHPDGSVEKVYDLYGSVGAFAEDLFLHEEASPQEPKNASGLEDSYLNALDAI
ncbi:hypothetical protein MTO96_002531 [Rhipicephalus appendiculatus]